MTLHVLHAYTTCKVLHISPLIATVNYAVGVTIIPILQMKKLKFREV